MFKIYNIKLKHKTDSKLVLEGELCAYSELISYETLGENLDKLIEGMKARIRGILICYDLNPSYYTVTVDCVELVFKSREIPLTSELPSNNT